MRGQAALIMLAAALAVAGCASSDPEAAPVAETGTSAAATTTTAVPVAPATAFEQVVAERHDEWDQLAAETDASCLDPAPTAICHTKYFTLGMQSRTIGLSLSALHKQGAPGYVGEVPDEIERLVADTEHAAQAAADAIEAMIEAPACEDPMAYECTSMMMAVTGAVSDLGQKLDGWSVY